MLWPMALLVCMINPQDTGELRFKYFYMLIQQTKLVNSPWPAIRYHLCGCVYIRPKEWIQYVAQVVRDETLTFLAWMLL